MDTISGSSSARQRNAIQIAFCRRAEAAPTLNAGLVAMSFSRGSGPVLLKNPIFFLIFQMVWGGSGPPVPRLDPPMLPKILLLLKWRIKWVAYIKFFTLQCIIPDKKYEVKIYLSYDVARLGVK